MVQLEVLLGTLGAGFIIGYLAQRTRMCFIGGVRDYYLIRDAYLAKGAIGFLIGALIVIAVSSLFTSVPGWPWIVSKGLLPIPGAPLSSVASTPLWVHMLLAVIGGLGLGLFSVLAGGCPLRQHVMASDGNISATAYLIGFYLGAIALTAFILPIIVQLLS